MNLLKEKAIKLRAAGYSYRMIGERLDVSKSTLSNWLTNIPFEPNAEVIQKVGHARLKSALWKQKQKFESMKKAKEDAVKDIGTLSKRDLFLLGIGLYLGEGEKAFPNVRIVNSDPGIVRLAVRWLRDACGAEKENLKPSVHIYPDNDIPHVLKFWSRVTGIPVSRFGKTIIDQRKNKSALKKRKLPYGTLHLRIVSNRVPRLGVYLHRKILAWIEKCIEQV